MGIHIRKAGFQTMVMDQGRKGTRSLGIPTSGVIDLFQYWWANGLVGHSDFSNPGPPVLEIGSGGVEILFLHAHRFALTGSPGHFMLDGMRISRHTTYFAQKGQILHVSSVARNGTVYLAINGQWKVETAFGSASTDILSPFPGTCGHFVHRGTEIEIEPIGEYTVQKRGSPDYVEPLFPIDKYTLRIMAGPELHWIDHSKKALWVQPYTITRTSNRMGFRLESTVYPKFEDTKMISSIVVPGTIQWPVGGQPILLLPNCQTTGGYPRIGVVIEADMWKLAYVGPQDRLQFKWVTRDEAVYLSRYQMGQFNRAWHQTFKQDITNHSLLY